MHTKTFYYKSHFLLCLFVTIIFTLNSCDDEADEKVQTNKTTQLILGKWTNKSGATFAINDVGEEIVTATLKPNVIGYEFFANGDLIGYEFVTNTSEKGSWKLENVSQSDTELKAILAITSPTFQASKGELSVDDDGYQRYEIGVNTANPNTMNWITQKKYEAYPYKQNWAEILLSK